MTSATVSISSSIPGTRTASANFHYATATLAAFTREDTGTRTLVRLEGSFDALSAPEARPALDAVVSDQRSPVAIDMSALRLIDSSGVGAVVSLYKRVRAQGGQVSVQGLNGQPRAIFKLLRLDRLMAC
jgi:anti-sigma B factor antagonist